MAPPKINMKSLFPALPDAPLAASAPFLAQLRPDAPGLVRADAAVRPLLSLPSTAPPVDGGLT